MTDSNLDLADAVDLDDLAPDVDALAAGELPDMSPADVLAMMGITDIDPADLAPDDDPFEALLPEWRRFATHLLDMFDPSALPQPFNLVAPAAPTLVAKYLSENPAESRVFAVELINVAVRDLGLRLDELECWAIHQHTGVEAAYFAPLPPAADDDGAG